MGHNITKILDTKRQALFNPSSKHYLQECRSTVKSGATLSFINFGGALTSLILVCPKSKRKLDIALGYSDYKDYFSNHDYLGAIIGRIANRIANSRFSLANQEIKLDANHGPHHIHGGKYGLSFVSWDIKVLTSTDEVFEAELSYLDSEKSGSYPGTVAFIMRYSFSQVDEQTVKLSLEFKAIPDQPTILNLTYHPYFNLAGHDKGSIANHIFQIPSCRIAENDDQSIATGRILDVSGESLDITKPQKFRDIAKNPDEFFSRWGGFDFYYFLGQDNIMKEVALVKELESRVQMKVSSTLPGVQFYTACFLNVTQGKNGASYHKNSSFCLEPQYAPASVFKSGADYPSIIFSKENPYRHIIEYEFSFF